MRKVSLSTETESGLLSGTSLVYMTVGLYFGITTPISKQRTVSLYKTILSAEKLMNLGMVPNEANTLANSSISRMLNLTTCREIITNFVRKSFADIYEETTKLDKLRLFLCDVRHKRYQMRKSPQYSHVVKALNVIEREKGWKPTRMYNVDVCLENKSENIVANPCMLIAPKQWIYSPYALSMYLLLLRFILNLYIYTDVKKAPNDIEDLTKILKNCTTDGCSMFKSDQHYLYGPKNRNWRLLLDNFDEIHQGNKKEHWLLGLIEATNYYRTISSLYTDGLDKLFYSKPYNSIIGERFDKIVNKKL